MFNSGKENGFNCLVYMHRYNPMTIAQIRTDYLLHYQGILENMRNNIENELEQNETENFLSASDKKEKSKKLKDLSSSLNEISKYSILIKDYADRKVSIDLDDGVAVNYGKFKDLLVKIK
jgi:ABC-type phosphate transport system auxiliary subunit